MTIDLIIPIYVDTNALLDLLASIEDGFSFVEKITTRSVNNNNIDREINAGTEFGTPNVLSLLKITLGYGAKWGRSKESGQDSEYEKYHTYGSLFHRLREYLANESLIKRLHNEEDWDAIQSSDFIEIRGIFRPNPLGDSLGILNRLIGITELFSSNQQTFVKKPKGKLTDEQRKDFEDKKAQAEKAKIQLEQMNQIRKFLDGVLADIENENIRSFVIDSAEGKDFAVVALLYPEYLRDKTMTEISYREYRVLGKVVRKLEVNSEESIDLLSGTALGGVGEEMMNNLVSGFSDVPGMNLPRVDTRITGPALEIIPIAIFV